MGWQVSDEDTESRPSTVEKLQRRSSLTSLIADSFHSK